MLRKLFALNQKTTLLDIGFLCTHPNSIILVSGRRIKIEIFLVTAENTLKEVKNDNLEIIYKQNKLTFGTSSAETGF